MDLAATLGLANRALVSFVGAGGKKTAMARLTTEGIAQGHRIGSTTTVHTPPPPELPLRLADPAELASILGDAPDSVAFAHERVENPDRAAEKLRGFDPTVVDRLFRRDRFDWLLVKADGARRREFKAPGPDEPRLPRESTTVVPVASVHAVGEPLAPPTVHRPERVAAITGKSVGDTITTDTIAAVLANEKGGLAGVPDGATVVPMINKADTETLETAADGICREILSRSDRIDRTVVAALERGRWRPVVD